MSERHLTEEMLQQYALNPAECPEETVTHLFECAECRTAVSAYEQIGKALEEQPAPAFAFNLAAAVMAELDPVTEVAEPAAKPWRVGRLLIPLIALLIAIPAWFFWRTAYFVFSGTSTGLACIILGFAGVAVLFSFLKYYRKYQQVLHLLNN